MEKLKNLLKLPIDKQAHFMGCFAIAASFYILLGWVWPSFYAAVLAGIFKEAADQMDDNNRWSWGDIVADLLGASFFIALFYLSKIFL